VERRSPFLLLKIEVTASLKELVRDGRMTFFGRDVERRVPSLVLKVDGTSNC